jgi:endothelin-converting enzyme
VIITHPPYAIYLSKLLEETPSNVIEAHLVIRAALALSPYLGLTTEAWQAQRSLMESLTGIKKGAVGDRSEYCIGQVENALGFAAGRFFVNETFAGDSREKGTKVITGQASACNAFRHHLNIFTFVADIVKSFKESLKHLDWMDEKSANAAAEKVRDIGHYLSP